MKDPSDVNVVKFLTVFREEEYAKKESPALIICLDYAIKSILSNIELKKEVNEYRKKYARLLGENVINSFKEIANEEWEWMRTYTDIDDLLQRLRKVFEED